MMETNKGVLIGTFIKKHKILSFLGFLKNKFSSIEMKLILTGLYIAFFMYLTVEPALEASVHLVTPWIFVNGIVHGCLINIKSYEK